jgi:glycine betaine catabolism A
VTLAPSSPSPLLGFSFPGAYYTDPARFERELERIFLKEWLFYAHGSEMPNRGDRIARDMFGESVVVVRQSDGSVAGHLNICRHRGGRLCEVGASSGRTLTCPYHAWSWKPDGSLIPASARFPEDSSHDPSNFGLMPVHVEEWRGLIFISLATERPPALSPEIERCIPLADTVRFEDIKQIAVKEYVLECNWKLAAENFLECFHCGPVHGALSAVQDNEAEHELFLDYDSGKYQASAAKVRVGVETLSLDGKYVCSRLFGAFGEGEPVPEKFGIGMTTQPNSFGILWNADYGAMFEFIPLGVDRTLLVNRWFVHAEAVEGEDYEVERVMALWDVTDQEDAAVLAGVQKSMRSRRYVPGPLDVEREVGIPEFMECYRDAMGE